MSMTREELKETTARILSEIGMSEEALNQDVKDNLEESKRLLRRVAEVAGSPLLAEVWADPVFGVAISALLARTPERIPPEAI